MKNISMFCLLLVSFGFVSCKNEEKQKAKEEIEKPISVACYQALYEQDTIDLTVNTLKNGKLIGKMIMKIENMSEKTGTIAGEYRGDTLFADYSFIQGDNKDRIFKNPMAFLKSNNELILGSGEITTYLGKSYFSKDKPINFKNVKYKFKSIDCIEK